jgi:c-di-GMP-binding flagellar brake protein YcgR
MKTSSQLHTPITDRHIELLQPEGYEEYLLHSHSEILAILAVLRDDKSLITLYFDHSGQSLLTSLLGVSENGLALDFCGDAKLNGLALASERMIAATSQDKVKIQFPVGPLKQGLYQGQSAFAAPLPKLLLRLQRREFYRLPTPSARPIKCRIPAASAHGPHKSVDANIIDIGGGGLAVMVPPDDLPFEAGMNFQNCRIELPEVGIVVSNLHVRGTFEVTAKGGLVARRAGCQFVNLPGPMLTLIQRYIMRIERERKARSTETD